MVKLRIGSALGLVYGCYEAKITSDAVDDSHGVREGRQAVCIAVVSLSLWSLC